MTLRLFFFTIDEVDSGCVFGPSLPLGEALLDDLYWVDDRLLVTAETLERIVEWMTAFDLSQLHAKYKQYVLAVGVSWQINMLEAPELHESVVIKHAAGIACAGRHAYISDSTQHAIFRVDLLTDEVKLLCGMRNGRGLQDGPGEVAKFQSPSGLVVCEWSSTLYVCDTGNDAIRAVALPSGVVHTLSLTSMDLDARLTAPNGICMVWCNSAYEESSCGDDEYGYDFDNDAGSEGMRDEEDEDCVPQLAGISEEDCESSQSSNSSSSERSSKDNGTVLPRPEKQYALADTSRKPSRTPAVKGVPPTLMRHQAWASRRSSTMLSGLSCGLSSRRSSRRPSTQITHTPHESARASLQRCASSDEGAGLRLAVTSDHCIFIVSPVAGVLSVLAGSPDEYGYRDSEIGSEARFSSLKGITCIRNSVFVADHWNNVIRCIDLKTRQVDTVIDFDPCGPIALSVSSSGHLYVLDTEHITVCNILKICSEQRSLKDGEGALGTAMFQMIQDSIGRSRASSRRSSRDAYDWNFIENLSRKGSARASRRASAESDCSDVFQRRVSLEHAGSRRGSHMQLPSSRRNSMDRRKPEVYCMAGRQDGDSDRTGNISTLGPRSQNFGDFGPVDATSGSGVRLQVPIPQMTVVPAPSEEGSPLQLSIPVPSADPSQPTLSVPTRPGLANSMSQNGTPCHSQSHQLRSSNAGSQAPQDVSTLPVVPQALKSLVPGASLHPALIMQHARPETRASTRNSRMSGSQFRISVLSSERTMDDFENSPELVSFLNPEQETPWERISIGTLRDIYEKAIGTWCANEPLSLCFWDAADADVRSSGSVHNTQQLLIGSTDYPSVLRLLPPRTPIPNDCGRFRTVAVDSERVIMSDRDSHQIYVVNHARRTRDKVAGCGKVGYLDGPLDVCRMNQPLSLALDPHSHLVYVADSGNHRIRCIDLVTGFMRTVCGNGAKGNRDGIGLGNQSLNSPFDLQFMHPCSLLISCADSSVRALNLQTSQLDTILLGS